MHVSVGSTKTLLLPYGSFCYMDQFKGVSPRDWYGDQLHVVFKI